MKKRMSTILLPVLAGAAVIGSGFSVWFFNDTNVSATQDQIGKEVTQLVAVGTITKADDFTMTFDQTADGRKANNITSTAAANGITLQWNDDSANKIAKYESIGSTGETIDHDGDKIYFEFNTKITISNSLAEYITISYEGATSEAQKGATDTDYSFTLGENETEFKWATVSLNYAEGKEPSNAEQYAALKTAVKNATITVTYRVDVKSK